MKPYVSTLISLAFFGINLVILLIVLYLNRRETVSKVEKKSIPPTQPAMPAAPFLQASDILGWEFDYASKTASESMQDRHTMVNFYLIVTGVVASGVVGLLSSSADLPEFIGTVLLWVLCLIGWLYFLKLVRLREAWYDSARAMNEIKKFYFQFSENLPLDLLRTAFRWKPETLPPPNKKWTVFFYSATLVGLLNSVAFVFGGVLLDSRAVATSPWVGGILVVLGLGLFAFNEWLYFALLKPKSSPDARLPQSLLNVSEGIIALSTPPDDLETQKKMEETLFNWKKTPSAPDPEGLVKVHEEIVDYQLGKLFRIIRAKLQYRRFDGRMSELITRINFNRGDSVGVLLYDPQRDAVALVRQFRYPVYAGVASNERQGEKARQGWILETVAGVQDEGLSVHQVANKELLEEAGIKVIGDLHFITRFYASPGGTSERISLFLGEIDSQGRANVEGGLSAEGEDTQVVVIPFKDAMELVTRGEICDGKTIIALQYLELNKAQGAQLIIDD